jgi:hypothetical protein
MYPRSVRDISWLLATYYPTPEGCRGEMGSHMVMEERKLRIGDLDASYHGLTMLEMRVTRVSLRNVFG